jgi:uncharacterized protein
MFERFALDALPRQPWKNGCGTTREIAMTPAGASLADFTWRVSVAEIERAGAFSVFPGIDRVIVLLSGAGVRLRGGSIDHRLACPLEPFAFAGETPLEATLLGQPSRDLNVMTRRGVAYADVQVLRGASTLEACDALVLLAAQGHWRIASFALSSNDGVVACGGVSTQNLEALATRGALIAIRLLSEAPLGAFRVT